MHTKDKLAEALRAVGLDDMADRAAEGYYHDFLSPLDLPETQLLIDLDKHFAKHPTVELAQLRTRHLNGEFDASAEESEEWAASEEGRAIFGKLTRGE
jgi:hypothetical protein